MREKWYKWLGVGKSKHFLKKYKYIMLFSHMRSYTSLLGHLIGNHQSVAGYAEHHQSYYRDFHLGKLKYKLHILHGTTQLPEFLFDKILHNDYHINPDYLRHDRVFPIIVVRNPESVVKSIVNLGLKHSPSVRWYQDPNKVCKYYTRRLRRLEQYASIAGKNAFFFRAEDVKQRTDEILPALSDFIGLDTVLESNYNTFQFTGTGVIGDPGENIKKGKILSQQSDYSEIEIPEAPLQRAKKRYDQALIHLSNKCTSL